MTSFFDDFIGVPTRASIFEQNNPLNVLEFDASIRETHSSEVTITDHPVEKGSDISDHARRRPDTLQINGVVTNNPVVILRSQRALPSVRDGDPNTRAEDAYGFLLELQSQRLVVGCSTTLRDYANMLITSLSVPRESRTGTIADISLTLREIAIADTETTDAPEPTNPARKRKTTLGKKNKPAATQATQVKAQSILDKIFF